MTTPRPPLPTGALDGTLEDLLTRASTGNAQAHFYTQILAPRALRRAAALDGNGAGPWWGAPVTIKDNIDLDGVDTSCGRRLPPRPAAASAAIVTRLEALGAVIIGKTNLDEAALGATGRNPRFGQCANPHCAARLSGGSSSGAAASVAAGHVRLSLGTDTLGSVRIPAAFCGIAGFKPSHGVLPMAGVAPLYPRFDTVGLLGRSLLELRAAALPLLGAGVAGTGAPGSGAPASGVPGSGAPGTLGRHAAAVAVLDAAALAGVDPQIAGAYGRCVAALRESGWETPPASTFDWAATARTALWEVAHDFARRSVRGEPGYPGLGDLQDGLRELLDRALVRPPDRLAAGRVSLGAAAALLRQEVAAAVLLTPTCPQPAPLRDAELPPTIADFVAPANVAGLPAVCWPQRLGCGQSGVSLQLIGRFGEDRDLLERAASVERRLNEVFAV